MLLSLSVSIYLSLSPSLYLCFTVSVPDSLSPPGLTHARLSAWNAVLLLLAQFFPLYLLDIRLNVASSRKPSLALFETIRVSHTLL